MALRVVIADDNLLVREGVVPVDLEDLVYAAEPLPALPEPGPDAVARGRVAAPTTGMRVLTYSTVGLRGDCDFMLWRISYSLECLSNAQSDLMKTQLGVVWIALPPGSANRQRASAVAHLPQATHDQGISLAHDGQVRRSNLQATP